MSQLLWVALMALGASSCGAAVWFIANPALSKRWTRQWVLSRLIGTSHHAPLPKQQEEISVAHFLDAIAREVHSGYSLTLAFVQTVERFPSLTWWTEPIAMQCIRGHSLATAIANTSPQNWNADVALAARTLSVASNGGYGIVNALEKSASILREREHLAHERDAQTAQIRLSTAVLSWIPLIICAWVITQQTHTRTFLLHSPLGLLCVTIGLLLNIVGRKWITRIARNCT